MTDQPGDERRAPGPMPAAEARARWDGVLGVGPVTLADGAMGTMLFSSGLQFGDPPEVWNLTHPDLVRRIHRSYLEAGSRIVTISSVGHRIRAKIHFDDLQWERGYSRVGAYGQSKLANLLFTYELQRRLAAQASPTIAVAAHPGVSNTELARYSPAPLRAAAGLPGDAGNLPLPTANSPWEGADLRGRRG